MLQAVFHFESIVSKRSVFHCEHSGRTNDTDTIKFATFRYDKVEVENDLKGAASHFSQILFLFFLAISEISYRFGLIKALKLRHFYLLL